MAFILKLFGILIILSGISMLINPEIFFGWLEGMEKTSLYIFAIVARLFIGILFLTAAKESKYPVVIKIFGYLALLAAIIFLIMGQDNFQESFSSFIPEIKPYAPLIALMELAVGGFLFYAFSRNREIG